jgi:dethiobiotin synthetase
MAEYFVTGTDTGAGKTFIAAALLRVASGRGWRSIGIKPVAAGCAERDGGWVNDDAALLQASGNVALHYDQVNPVALRTAMAPHLAAQLENRRLDVKSLVHHCRETAALAHDVLLAEGAGGWLVPLNDNETMADLATALGWPVLLVVGMRLGCLNHALLTAQAVRAARLRLAGWVANSPWPEMPALAENVMSLEARLDAPCLGRVPFLGPDASVEAAMHYLDVSGLVG